MAKRYYVEGLMAEKVIFEVIAEDEEDAIDKVNSYQYESVDPDDNRPSELVRGSLEVVDSEELDADKEYCSGICPSDDDDEWEDDDDDWDDEEDEWEDDDE